MVAKSLQTMDVGAMEGGLNSMTAYLLLWMKLAVL